MASHRGDPKLDDMVLLEALKSPAFHIGALGSRVNTAKRRERLASSICRSTKSTACSRTPAEIAVAMLAEIIAVRNGVSLMQKKEGSSMPNAASHAGS